MTESFTIKIRLRQGDVVNFTVECSVGKTVWQGVEHNRGRTIFNGTHQYVASADDVAVVSRIRRDLDEIFITFLGPAKEVGL